MAAQMVIANHERQHAVGLTALRAKTGRAAVALVSLGPVDHADDHFVTIAELQARLAVTACVKLGLLEHELAVIAIARWHDEGAIMKADPCHAVHLLTSTSLATLRLNGYARIPIDAGRGDDDLNPSTPTARRQRQSMT
jgi:hypothetical protein